MSNIQRIRDAVKSGDLVPPFRAAQVNKVLGITYACEFMAQYSRPNNSHIYFVRISPGLYRLK